METVEVQLTLKGHGTHTIKIPKDVMDYIKERADREFGGDVSKSFHVCLRERLDAYERAEAEKEAKGKGKGKK